jgi:hypothetical protein
MKKVLFIANSLVDGMMLSYFMPYIIERGVAVINPNDTPQIPIQRWYEQEVQTLENIDKFYKFKFEDTEIDFKFVVQAYEDINQYMRFAKEQTQQEGYDKVFLFARRLFIEGVEKNDFTNIDKNILEVIYLNVSEAIHTKNNTLRNFLKDNKVISCSNISYTNTNFYYEPFLNLIYSYYQYGFDFYPYNKLDIKKQNLIGMYLKKNYKVSRDKMHNDIQSKFINKNVDRELLEIYKESKRPNFFTKFNCLHTPAWDSRCHTTSYLDYITSVCAYTFETTNFEEFIFPYQSLNRQYITEKTLKAILYSKMDIPFIMDMNPINFVELHEMGFWFLNSEFYNESIKMYYNDELPCYSHMEESVIDASIYLKSLKEEYKTNTEVHKHLMKTYGHKLQKNVKLLKEILSSYSKKENVLNLIKNGNRN